MLTCGIINYACEWMVAFNVIVLPLVAVVALWGYGISYC